MSRRISLAVGVVLLVACISSTFVAAPVALAARPVWYLAEGTTSWGFDCTVSILNPYGTAEQAVATYMGDAGVIKTVTYPVPATSQLRVNVADEIGRMDFSLRVECPDVTKTLAVDRTMYWMGGPGAENDKTMEIHNSIGVTAPSNSWFLPEGSSAWGFETWVLVQNPNGVATDFDLIYMPEDGNYTLKHRVIPANSRRTYSMFDDIGTSDASILVQSTMPVIVERSMYRNERRSGTDSIGAAAPATDFYLAEGSTAWGFTTYVLVQNPNPNQVTVNVTFNTSTGPVAYPAVVMLPYSRKTIRVNDFLPDKDCSTEVHALGGQPIVAERAMYWGAGTPFGEAAHASIGIAGTHPNWFLPDGGTGDLEETWTLVQNPNPVPVDININYMSPTGTVNTKTDHLLPSTRKTYNMADAVTPGNYAAFVTCTNPGLGIIVERAMYYDTEAWGGKFKTAGSDTIGGWDD
jgi:hypothetical protein